MKNLLQETFDKFSYHGKCVEDIDWIGSEDYNIPIDLFFEIANVDYDDGCNTLLEVAYDLKIVFKDGSWLERTCRHGFNQWVYCCPPKKPSENYTFPFITRGACENYLRKYEPDIHISSAYLSTFVKKVNDVKGRASQQ